MASLAVAAEGLQPVTIALKDEAIPGLTAALSGAAVADADLTVAYCGQPCGGLAVRLSNLGPGDATGTRLTLTGVTSASPPQGGVCSTTSTGTVCSLGDVKAGGTVDVDFSVSGSAVVEASVTAGTNDPTTANNTATISVPG